MEKEKIKFGDLSGWITGGTYVFYFLIGFVYEILSTLI